jgi:anti-sigma B factor antagonist
MGPAFNRAQGRERHLKPFPLPAWPMWWLNRPPAATSVAPDRLLQSIAIFCTEIGFAAGFPYMGGNEPLFFSRRVNMYIETRQSGKAMVVCASGRIDAMTAPAFETSLSEAAGAGQLALVLDLGGVEYISSAGLRVILAVAKPLKGRGGELLLANAQGPVKEVLDISGFGSVFSLYDSVDAAISVLT